MSARPRVSLVVPTRNRAKTLAATLNNFLSQDLPVPYEVVVVDDGSEDETPDLLSGTPHPRLKTVRTGHRGAAHARNRGVEAAAGGIIVFCDDDGLVRPDFLAHHLKMHSKGPSSIVGTGPIITVRTLTDSMALPGPGRGRHRNFFPSGNASLHRTLFEKTGGFVEDFDQYGWEDMELAIRLKKAGAGRRFSRRAALFHYKPHNERGLRHNLELEIQRGRMGALFHSLHPSPGVAFLTKTGRPFTLLDRALDRLFHLEEKTQAVLNGVKDPNSIGTLRSRLLLFHTETRAANEKKPSQK